MPGPEKTFETKVKDFIESVGGWQVKYFANRMTKKGIPDVLACVNGYFIALEIKAQRGTPSELQIYQCKEIRAAGGFAFIVYPSGYDMLRDFIYNLKREIFNLELPIILK